MADIQAKYYDGVLPSPIAPDDEKQSKVYGLAVAKAISSNFMNGENSYYYRRNAIISQNRIIAAGKQDIKEYLSVMDIDAGAAFVNLKHHPRPIAPKFRDIMVNSIMEKTERVKTKGLSLEIADRKEQKVLDAAFRMKEKDFVQGISQESGVQFEDENAFTPESEEELNIWKDLNDQEHEELLMAEGINFVFTNNEWEVSKKEIAESIVDTGFAFVKNDFDGNKRIVVKTIRPEKMVYSPTDRLVFDKGSYIGHVEKMTISDARLMWPDIAEKSLWEIAKRSYGTDNTSPIGGWEESFANSFNRPYDGYTIEVLFFEYRVTKFVKVLKTKDKNGKKIVEFVGPRYDKDGQRAEDKELVSKPIPAIYSGAWIIGSQVMAKWGEQSDQLRNNENVNDLSFSYAGYMVSNDGSMLPTSPIAFMKSPIFQMELSILKIQQHLAGAAPDGTRIDIDAAVDLDMGKGVGTIGFMELKKIRHQTGDEYWSSSKISGEGNRPPLEQAIHSMGDKISQFITVYNFELNNIRDYIAINEVKDGTGVNPRMGLQVMNNQINASNTGTAHLYLGYIYIYGKTSNGVGIRLWDTLKQAEPNSMYMRILGNSNVDFIRKRKILTASNYDVLVSIDMSDNDKQWLDRMIEASLQTQSIEFEDAVYIRRIANLELAMRYLIFAKKKRAKEVREHELQMQKAQQDNGALISKQQQDQQQAIQTEKMKMDMQAVQEKAFLDHKKLIQELINEALITSMNPTMGEIPAYVQALMNQQQLDDKKRMDDEVEQQANDEAANDEAQAMELQTQQ